MDKSRLHIVRVILYLGSIVIVGRLFYWQVIQSSALKAEAQNQRTSTQTVSASRGSIMSSDGFVLTSNQDYYLLYSYKPQLEQDLSSVSKILAPLLLDEPKDATEAAKPESERVAQLEADIFLKLSDSSKKWVPIKRNLDRKQKESIEALGILGLGFDAYERRSYPEASMSAHLLGFVGHDEQGNPQGYFGLEGQYNLELQGREGKIVQETDATGKPILIGLFDQLLSRKGRNLELHLDRSIQYLAEKSLLDGLEKYGASSGEVLIMNPYTGGILAMASYPNYDPFDIGSYSPDWYKNPSIANTYEPGSTFKVLVMAAGIEEGVITPETICGDACAGPAHIGKYSIQTWNGEYDTSQSMTEVLANSDNTGMIFVAQKLGKDTFVDYVKKFGFGQLTGIDLQEETGSSLRNTWGDIDVATTSFGQGIAVTGIQMLRAVASIANGGNLVVPHVVSTVEANDERLTIEPKIERRVLSEDTAKKVTEMMIESAHHGESQWAVLKEYEVAGKTGTAQIPILGHYDEEKTIASFVGF
ncbi:MAG: hypothetical protein COU65_03230, partial [Candidatus Pacebacteria bacterium CG10_big_fil_rev_8_21_14_0_10_42_12]